ncbi:MAG TPA: CHAT domain-containing tetratricopeptide repeat protein [Cyclobacteriaceae bacterium]|nr:CHAT domain-containing tetratricopeptide repeat protein [Cyclobacteriaceae bacterium]
MEASRRFGELNNPEGLVYCYNMIAEIYIRRLFDEDKADRYIRKSKKVALAHMPSDHVLIGDLSMIDGSIQYYFDTDSSLRSLDRAITIYSKWYGQSSIQVAECYFRKGQTYKEVLSLYDSSHQSFQKALAINKENLPPDHPSIIKILYYFGSYYRLVNDYRSSIIYTEQALEHWLNDSLRNMNRIASGYALLANTYNDLLEDSLAIFNYNKSIGLYSLINKNNPYLCLLYMNLGVNYLRNHNYPESLINLNKSLELYEKLDADDLKTLSDIYMHKGDYYAQTGRFDSAEIFLKKSLFIINKDFAEDRIYLADRQQTLGKMFDFLGNSDSSLWYYQSALVNFVPDFREMDYRSNPPINFHQNRVMLYDILLGKAGAIRNKYYRENAGWETLVQAYNIYQLLDELKDQMRNSRLTEESQVILTPFFQEGTESGIECALELYRKTSGMQYLETVLKFMEKNKYMQLFKALRYAETSDAFNVPRGMLEGLGNLRREIAAMDQAIDAEKRSAEASQDTLRRLTNERFLLAGKEDSLIAVINKKYPNYFHIQFDSLTVAISGIRELLAGKSQLFIEYYFGKKKIYFMGISKNHVSVHELDITLKLTDDIKIYLSSISKFPESDAIQDNYEKFCRSSNALYNQLIFPVLDEHKMRDARDILIVPDGILAQVPFEALVKVLPEKGIADYSRLGYLINDHLIHYAYSANIQTSTSPGQTKAKNNLLAFSYSSEPMIADASSRSARMYDLPGTHLELTAIRKLIKRNSLFFADNEATKQNFKSNASDYRIVHLAIHGQADMESPLNSRLVFRSGADGAQDPNLYVYELYGMDLSRTDLSVLSACETGIGKEFHGEGVFSIARGFAYAGCPSLVMSLWKVDDRQSAKIMEAFYRQLRKGKNSDAALRNSKLMFIQNSRGLQSHPSNWAAFVFQGRAQKFYDPKVKYFITLATLALLALIIFNLIALRTRKLLKE